MDKFRILIADDEQGARELIIHYLEQSPIEYEVFQAADGGSAFELLREQETDILFLDIKMPEMDGIEILQRRDSSPLPAIIFTTAFDEYAIPAFDYEATDYLLKPFEKTRFAKALEKATKYVRVVRGTDKKSWLTQLSVKTGSKMIILPVNEIDYFQSDGAYVQVNSNGKTWLLSSPLYEVEAKLNPEQFIRVHKSVIINIESVKEINSLLNGDCIIKMKNGKQLRGSRTYKNRMKERLKM